MTRWVEVPVDTYLDRRHRNWVLAEEFGDVRFSGDVVLVHPARAEHIVRALRGGPDEVLLEEVLALPARIGVGVVRVPAASDRGVAREVEPSAVISGARRRWRAIVGWLGIVVGAAVFVAALVLPLDDPALMVALMLAMRGGRLILGVDSWPAPVPTSQAWTAAASSRWPAPSPRRSPPRGRR